MIVEQFIRKLNNTELNTQNTNDAYIRISKVIQDFIPITFFKDLDSQKIKVTEKKSKRKVDNWVRYQYYPANKEYRIANLSSIYKSYNASPGDLIYIEKISIQSEISYIVYMKNYAKVCMKFSKSNNAFEILNLTEVKSMNILEKDIILSLDGVLFDSKISFNMSKKKRTDSPQNTDFFEIKNLPVSFTKKIDKDSFVEISLVGNKYNLEVHKSWHFNKFTK